MISVAIVSPERSLNDINKVIDSHDFGCHFFKFIYNELSDIDRIYEECKSYCDVIFFSGELGYHYIHQAISDIELPCAFTAYGTQDVLAILLRFVLEHPGTDLSRVFVDFLTPLNNFMNIPDYLPPEHTPYCFEDLFYNYDYLTERACKLWHSGKIDYVITRSINNLKRLETLDIPFFPVFPTEEMIRQSIQAAVDEIRLKKRNPHNILAIIIRLPMKFDCPLHAREFCEATLYKVLVDLREEMGYSYDINKWYDRFELLQISPENDSLIPYAREFIQFLQQRIDFPFRCGIGVHTTEDRSRYYAETALLESIKHGDNDGFLVKGADEMLVGPLSIEQPLQYTYSNEQIIAFAHEHGISEHNLVTLIALLEQNPTLVLTAASIGQHLNITSRSANRILSQLHKKGLIVRISTSNGEKKKGRPLVSYQLEQENFRSIFSSISTNS